MRKGRRREKGEERKAGEKGEERAKRRGKKREGGGKAKPRWGKTGAAADGGKQVEVTKGGGRNKRPAVANAG